MRTTLLIALFALSIGLSSLGLLIIRIHIQNQIHMELASDLARSVISFQQQQNQQLAMLERQASLLANLPSLKALLTTQDDLTIADGSLDFWKLSESSFFALLRPDGRLITYSNQGSRLDRSSVANELRVSSQVGTGSQYSGHWQPALCRSGKAVVLRSGKRGLMPWLCGDRERHR